MYPYVLETKKSILLVSNKYGFGCLLYLRFFYRSTYIFLSAWVFMLVVPAVVSVFSYLGSYGIGTEISCMLF